MSGFAAAAIRAAGLLGPVFRGRARDKRPLRKGWQAEASADPATIARLWRECPDANVGLLCGVTAWALDVDRLDGLDTIAELEDRHRWLPVGPASVTGTGGQHRSFRATPRVRNSVRRLGPGLDTRGTGGFVVLPPSLHPNGNRYAWLPGREPWSVPLPDAPAWLLNALDPPRAEVPRTAARAPQGSSAYVAAAMAGELDRVALAPAGRAMPPCSVPPRTSAGSSRRATSAPRMQARPWSRPRSGSACRARRRSSRWPAGCVAA